MVTKTKKGKTSRWRTFLIAGLAVLAADQLAKYSVLNLGIEHMPVINGFFSIVSAQNFGASFGMLQHKTAVLIFVSVIIIILLIALLRITPERAVPYSGLMAGGALSNLLDRLIFGFVVDYLDFPFWPSFNIADIAITIGAAGIAVYLLREVR